MKLSKWIGVLLFFCTNISHSQIYNININDKVIPVAKTDDTLMGYMDEVMKKAKEINNEADACYYSAINKKELDISCKNYNTLLERDFNPLVKKVGSYIKENPPTDISKDQLQVKLDELDSLAKEADEKYNKAINYLDYIYKKN